MTRSNSLAAILLVSVLVPLGIVQAVASVAVRAYAQPFSWMRHVPPAAAAAVDRLGLHFRLPGTLALVLARQALVRGDVGESEREAMRLAPSSDRLVLLGDLAQARGDLRSAARAYLAAGDIGALEEHVAALVRRGDLAAALSLQTEAVERLHDDRTQGEALAQAYFQLGVLRQALAYRFDVGTADRRANAVRSERAYARAVALAPLDEQYLLAQGNQLLNLGEIAAAERTFVRARDANPASAAAFTGLGEAALRRGDRAAARDYLARARARDAGGDAVRRLAAELGA